MLDPMIILVTLFLVSYWLTWIIRQYAIRRAALLDVPNERSSHTTPTPRGGGLAIVIAFTAGIVYLAAQEIIALNVLIALIGGLAVALIGFIDDRKAVSWRMRGAVHFGAAVWLIGWAGGMPALHLGFTVIEWGIIGHVVGVIGVVWLINLYNFMDGIDGLAAGEAVTVALIGGVLVSALAGSGLAAEGVWLTASMLAAGCLGFLFWNWNPARIFMGDVGSGFLGYTFAALAIISAQAGESAYTGVLLWVWLILLGVFVVDATVTVIRRMLRGEKWYQAHRSHAYQKLVTRWGNDHRRVTRGILLLNIFWLGLWALVATLVPPLVLVFTAIALIPLVILAIMLKAGMPT